MNNLSMLFIIVNTSDERAVVKCLKKFRIGFKFVMHGMGTASSSMLEYFGLNEEEKAIVMTVIPFSLFKKVIDELENKINFKEHGRGIAFSIPLSSSTKYMVDFYKNYEMEDDVMEEVKDHLIVTIVNQGYAEKVMTEAKKAGAGGGTTINGRGLETDKVIKFLNIAIEPEKDIVLNLVSSEKKNDIMNAIVLNCGLKTPGAGICFSLPVDMVAGISNGL